MTGDGLNFVIKLGVLFVGFFFEDQLKICKTIATRHYVVQYYFSAPLYKMLSRVES
jgi:hypothetical protein